MEGSSLLTNLVLMIFISIIIVYVLRLIKMPPLIGFLIAGTLLGPHCFGLIANLNTIKTIAEIGVILLLFSVGLEFPINEFKRYSRLAFIG